MSDSKANVVNALTHLGATFKELAKAQKTASAAIQAYADDLAKDGSADKLAQFPAIFGSLEGLVPEKRKPGRPRASAAADDDDEVDGKKRRRGPNKEKKVKDPNAPKRPASAYLEYQNSVREEYRQQFPDMSYSEVLKKIGSTWQQMSDAEKKPWQDLTAEKKTVYLAKKDEYEKTGGSPGASPGPVEPKEVKKHGRKSEKSAEAVGDIPVEDPKKKAKSTPAKKAATPASESDDDSDDSNSDDSDDSESESEATPPPKKAKKERATKKTK
ncbi:hypothetical protein JCM3770_006244 [Rhodotorula araucariae]